MLNAYQSLSVGMASAPAAVRVNGLDGTEFIQGSGFLVPTATSMHLELTGGAGGDNPQGGLLSGDRLSGEVGDVSFRIVDGQPGDVVSGGADRDTATIDTSDQTSLVEVCTKPAGTLALSPTQVVAEKGSADVSMSWTHASDLESHQVDHAPGL